MEVHRQTCQECGGRVMRNILCRDAGQFDKVYVQCAGCKGLVARYVIGQRGYYHHGKGYESYLRGLNRGGHFDSGKNLTDQFQETIDSANAEFERVLETLDQEGKTEG